MGFLFHTSEKGDYLKYARNMKFHANFQVSGKVQVNSLFKTNYFPLKLVRNFKTMVKEPPLRFLSSTFGCIKITRN